MTDEASGKVRITFAKGVLDDVAELTATTVEGDQASKDEAEALKRRIAELLVEPTHKAKPRFRLIYRNEPTDGASRSPHPQLTRQSAPRAAAVKGA